MFQAIIMLYGTVSLYPPPLPLKLGPVGSPQHVLLGHVHPEEQAAGTQQEEDHRSRDGPPGAAGNSVSQSVHQYGVVQQVRDRKCI